MEDSETIAVTPAITISTLSSMISVTSQNSVDLLTSVSTMDSNSMETTSSGKKVSGTSSYITEEYSNIKILVPSKENLKKHKGSTVYLLISWFFQKNLDRTERRLNSTLDLSNQSDPIMPIVVAFQCESGDKSDCFINMPKESLSEACNGILMFSNISSSCGENCNNIVTQGKIKRKGWTLFTRFF